MYYFAVPTIIRTFAPEKERESNKKGIFVTDVT